MTEKSSDSPGRLKHGNPTGDLSSVPRCGAKTRCGSLCKQPAMKSGRCRLHGGKSTGPRTPEGRRRIAEANFRHGRYTKQTKQQQREFRTLLKGLRDQLLSLDMG
jgi:hypothetical protein